MRGRKPKVGRPRLPKGEAKAIVLQSRVQPTEKAAYQRAAKSQGVDLSTWVRETLNAAVENGSLK
jgi:predicted HicB family RNase H-like nuclease